MRLIMPLLLANLWFSCNATTMEDSSGKKSSEDEQIESEDVIPPTNISGAYLACAFESNADAAVVEELMGCRFQDDQGNKLGDKSIGDSYRFSFIEASSTKTTILVRDQLQDTRYDAIFLFFSETLDELARTKDGLKIVVDVNGEQTIRVEQRLSKITTKAENLPEVSQLDYVLIRKEILQDASSSTPGLPPIE